MKVLFWNIGKRFNDSKSELLNNLIDECQPDVFCIAEGSYSQEECQLLENLSSDKEYTTYYTPKEGKENYGIDYVRNGLKVFYKNFEPDEKYDFTHGRENGRIIRVNMKNDDEITSLIFLHNFSKNGNRESTKEQVIFISQLNQLISNGQLDKEDSRVVILGDFNLEPWDNILRNPKLVNSYFITKHLDFEINKGTKGALMFNPLTEELITKNDTPGGTFFSKSRGWALFDYPIYNHLSLDLDYNVIQSVNGVNIFDYEDLDHLPVLLKIK